MSELRGVSKGVSALAVAALLGLTTPGDAAAQAPLADEWLPWLGCWHAAEAPQDSPLVCVGPADGGGVALLSLAEGQPPEVRTLRADGVATTSWIGECELVERAEFSRDGGRVFVEGQRTCPGEMPRQSRGILAMVDHDRWIEVQAMEVRGRTVAWVQRYEPAPRARTQAAGQGELLALVDARAGIVAAAREVAASPITVDQIIEAHARTDAEAVRVWVAEQVQPLFLNADGLIRLANAGVSDEVIDVVVAVAYPERFAVLRDDPYYPRTPVRRPPVYPGWGPWGPYGYWGRGFWGPYYRPTVVVVRPGRDAARTVATGIRGRGYTRGTSGSGASAPAASPGSRDRPAAAQPSSGGSSKGTPSTRRAQPRD